MKKPRSESVMNIGTVIVIILLILKLTGTCMIPWIWVFMPWIFGLAALLLVFLVVAGVAVIAAITD